MLDKKIRDFFLKVETGVVTDAMNLLKIQGWTTGIHPFRPEERLFGPAFTLLGTTPKYIGENDYTLYDLAETWDEGDVLVVDGRAGNYSLMGENMVHVAQYWGLGGIVLNGRCRDYAQIRDLDIPVFGMGPAIALKKGKLRYTAYNVPVNIAGVLVNPGDYVLGDLDGVLVFPSRYAEDIMYQCQMIQEVEKEVEDAIRKKRPLSEIKTIVKKKSVLRA